MSYSPYFSTAIPIVSGIATPARMRRRPAMTIVQGRGLNRITDGRQAEDRGSVSHRRKGDPLHLVPPIGVGFRACAGPLRRRQRQRSHEEHADEVSAVDALPWDPPALAINHRARHAGLARTLLTRRGVDARRARAPDPGDGDDRVQQPSPSLRRQMAVRKEAASQGAGQSMPLRRALHSAERRRTGADLEPCTDRRTAEQPRTEKNVPACASHPPVRGPRGAMSNPTDCEALASAMSEARRRRPPHARSTGPEQC